MKKIATLALLIPSMLLAASYAADTDAKKEIPLPGAQMPAIVATYVITSVEHGVAIAEATGKDGPSFMNLDDKAGALKTGDEVRVTVVITKKSDLPRGAAFTHGPACKCRMCQQALEDDATVDELFDAASKIQKPEDLQKLKGTFKKLLRD